MLIKDGCTDKHHKSTHLIVMTHEKVIYYDSVIQFLIYCKRKRERDGNVTRWHEKERVFLGFSSSRLIVGFYSLFHYHHHDRSYKR